MTSINTEIQRICKPLFDKLDLSYFNYSRIYSNGESFTLISSPEYAEYFLKHREKVTILSPKPQEGIEPQTLISLWSERAPTWVMKLLADLGIHHPIMFSKVTSDYTENFAFGSKYDRTTSIETYFNNMLTLQRFCEYFKGVANHLIAKSNDPNNRIILGPNQHPFSLSDFIEPFNPDANDAIELKVGDQIIQLTLKQKQCLEYLAKGLSAKEIAAKMHISPRTVETHLNNVKNKLNLNYKSELLQMWEQAFYL